MAGQGKKPDLADSCQPREVMFVDYLLSDRHFHKFQAFQLAFPHVTSRNSASVLANKMLKKPKVKALLKKRVALRMRYRRLTANKFIREDAAIALFDPLSILDDQGSPLPLHHWPREARAALASLEMTQVKGKDGSTITAIKPVFHKKDPSLKRLGAMLKLAGYADVREIIHQGNINMSHTMDAETQEIVAPFAKQALNKLLEEKRKNKPDLKLITTKAVNDG